MTDTQDVVIDELSSLKDRADQMGIKYHPSIGVDKLREKVNSALTENTKPVATVANDPIKKATELVRIRVTCMNPNKREWQGEIFTVGNRAVGTLKKYVPFDTEWHVPRMLLNMIQARKCQIFYSTKDGRGNSSRKGKLIKEFNVEVLPALTENELKELAQRQAMAAGEAL